MLAHCLLFRDIELCLHGEHPLFQIIKVWFAIALKNRNLFAYSVLIEGVFAKYFASLVKNATSLAGYCGRVLYKFTIVILAPLRGSSQFFFLNLILNGSNTNWRGGCIFRLHYLIKIKSRPDRTDRTDLARRHSPTIGFFGSYASVLSDISWCCIVLNVVFLHKLIIWWLLIVFNWLCLVCLLCDIRQLYFQDLQLRLCFLSLCIICLDLGSQGIDFCFKFTGLTMLLFQRRLQLLWIFGLLFLVTWQLFEYHSHRRLLFIFIIQLADN